jgi:hypothetical protein
MSLLDEIVGLAVNDDKKVSILLRKCLILAARLKNDKLKEWAQYELNGYPNNENLPEHRLLPIKALGDFLGMVGRYRNAPLAPSNMPEDIRWWAKTRPLTDSIAVLESLLQSDEDPLKIAWPQDLVLRVRDAFFKGNSLIEAWQIVSKPAIAGVLDTVRTRVLSFALEMQSDIGNSDEALAKADPAKVDQQVVLNFYGGHNIIAGNISQISYDNVVAGDFGSLSAALKAIGVDDADLSLLETAVKEDPAKPDDKSLGVKVSAWLGKMAVKAGTGALKVGMDVGTKVVTAAVLKFYGLG